MSNEREEIVIKLQQNDTDQAKLREEHGRLETELAQLDKPKLELSVRDYGLCIKHRRLCGYIYTDVPKSTFFLVPLDGQGYEGLYSKIDKIVSIDGNFDDLKLLSEDLEEFAVTADGAEPDSFSAAISGPCIKLHCYRNYLFTIGQATKIHQKLGQLIATAKRREAQK